MFQMPLHLAELQRPLLAGNLPGIDCVLCLCPRSVDCLGHAFVDRIKLWRWPRNVRGRSGLGWNHDLRADSIVEDVNVLFVSESQF
jgi:hypothetical protein